MNSLRSILEQEGRRSKMTIKAFSEKYKIPYQICFEASYKVHPVETEERDKDFSEAELFDETDKILNKRMKKHTALLRGAQQAYINLHSTRKMEELKG